MKTFWRQKWRSLRRALDTPDRARTAAILFNRLNLGWRIQIARVDREKIKLERRLFGKSASRAVLVERRGYYKRHTLPADAELADYYRDSYWAIRGGKRNGVHERDIAHFQLLLEYLPKVISPGNTVLNFGAGHGGISHLFWAAGLNVMNIEPSGLYNPYQERFSVIDSLEKLPKASVDIIYGCHSLEHVSDIEKTKDLLAEKLKPPGWMFWQTPNVEFLIACSKGVLTMPANKNYLFEACFFESWMKNILLNEVVSDAEGKVSQTGPLRRILGSVFPPA